MESLMCLCMFHVVGIVFSSTIHCPLNETEWIVRSKTKLCQGSDVYHCLLVEDGKSRKEKCIEKTLILQGHCPIFTKDDYLHWMTCNTTGCPDTAFRSDEVYKYPVCYGYIDEKNNALGNRQLSEDNTLSLKIGIPIGLIVVLLVIIIMVIVVMKKRRITLPCFSRFGRNNDPVNDHRQSEKLIKKDEEDKPEYIDIGVRQLNSKKVIYVIGQLGNSVSFAGKLITGAYKNYPKSDAYENCTTWSPKYFNYLDFSDKFSKLSFEKVFKPKSVNFIDGWGGLWNENPCERQETVEILSEIVKQVETHKDIRFVIGLRTEIRDNLKGHLDRLGILIKENERQVLDSSSGYKIRTIEKEIKSLESSCSNKNCDCKNLSFDRVSEINFVPIGTYLVVKLMRLDHKMIPDFFKKDVGPLEAVRNHFEELMEGERIWNWLPYIVCVGYHDKTEIRQEIASAFDIPKSTLSNCKNINEYTKTVDKNELAPMWSHKKNLVKTEDNKREGNVIVFWHNFLYICAFHACYKKYPQKIMRHCNLDAILQLVRPKNQSEALTIEASNEEVDLFCEERLSKFGNDSLFLEHPLFQDWAKRKGEIHRTS